MSYSRQGVLIDSVNGRRHEGYRRHPEVSNQPEPDDYATVEEYEWARDNWDDVDGRATVRSPWYVIGSGFRGEQPGSGAYTVEDLQRIRSEKAWHEIRHYSGCSPPERAQLRMIVDEFLYETAGKPHAARACLAIV